MKQNVSERKREGSYIKPNCYKVQFLEDKFYLAYGELDKDTNEIEIQCDMELSISDFKAYFNSILNAIVVFEEETKEKFFIDEDEDNDE